MLRFELLVDHLIVLFRQTWSLALLAEGLARDQQNIVICSIPEGIP